LCHLNDFGPLESIPALTQPSKLRPVQTESVIRSSLVHKGQPLGLGKIELFGLNLTRCTPLVVVSGGHI